VETTRIVEILQRIDLFDGSGDGSAPTVNVFPTKSMKMSQAMLDTFVVQAFVGRLGDDKPSSMVPLKAAKMTVAVVLVAGSKV